VSFRTFFLLTIMCMLWALNMIVSRMVVGDMAIPPLWFAALRSLIVMLVLLPWLWPIPKSFLRVLLVTFAIGGGGLALMFIGLRDATASAASVVGLASAPITVIFAVIFLGEVVRWRRAAGIALTFVGVTVTIASPQDMQASLGLVVIFASAIVSSLGAVFLKTLELSPMRLQAWSGFSSTAALLPLSFLLETGQVETASAGGWGFAAALIYSALVVSILVHTLYFRMLQTHDVNVLAPLTLMTPVFAVIAGVLINGEQVGLPMLFGGLIALVGVLVILVRPGTSPFKRLFMRSRV